MYEMYTARYFEKTAEALWLAGMDDVVTMQVFQKEHSVLAGVKEATDLIRKGSYDTVKIETLPDGAEISPFETVMHITGPLCNFVELESIYLGVLARSTRVASNMRRVVDAAGGKPVLFMGDRFDRFENQAADGEAALIGGASAVCTAAMGLRRGVAAQGTMPHALIAACGGDIVKACRVMHDAYPDEPVSALVDFNNDCVGDSLKALAAFGKDLYSVRLDTSEKMMDESLARLFESGGETIVRSEASSRNAQFRGVNKHLVGMVRKALDDNGGKHVKIVVSGGFTPEKISYFEQENVPVDMYGVGSSIIKNGPDFTADVVLVNGEPMAKVGREYRPNDRLVEV